MWIIATILYWALNLKLFSSCSHSFELEKGQLDRVKINVVSLIVNVALLPSHCTPKFEDTLITAIR